MCVPSYQRRYVLLPSRLGGTCPASLYAGTESCFFSTVHAWELTHLMTYDNQAFFFFFVIGILKNSIEDEQEGTESIFLGCAGFAGLAAIESIKTFFSPNWSRQIPLRMLKRTGSVE